MRRSAKVHLKAVPAFEQWRVAGVFLEGELGAVILPELHPVGEVVRSDRGGDI